MACVDFRVFEIRFVGWCEWFVCALCGFKCDSKLSGMVSVLVLQEQ